MTERAEVPPAGLRVDKNWLSLARHPQIRSKIPGTSSGSVKYSRDITAVLRRYKPSTGTPMAGNKDRAVLAKSIGDGFGGVGAKDSPTAPVNPIKEA